MISLLELLEPRIAPATLINANTIEYQDVDGDLVQLNLSKGLLTGANLNDVFTFDSGDFSTQGPQVLQALDITALQFLGTDVTFKVITTENSTGAGQGLVDVGAILAYGNDLGKVTLPGALGKIEAGDGITPKTGVTSLTVNSLGTIDPGAFGLADTVSIIQGNLGALTVKGDVTGCLVVGGGPLAGIGKITIGGSLIAGAHGDAWIEATTGNIASVVINGNISGGSADNDHAAGIFAGGSLGKVTVGGSIVGGGFDHTGVLFAETSVGTVKIGGDLWGNAGEFSGAVVAEGKIGTVTIGSVLSAGNLHGGTGAFSGLVSAGTTLGAVTIYGSITGDDGDWSGSITGLTGLGTVTVKGGLLGGEGDDSGTIQAGSDAVAANIAKVFITGNVEGDSGLRSGTILAWGDMAQGLGGNMTQAWIGGSIIGGSGVYSALVYATNNFGKADVLGDLLGGDGYFSGRIATDAGNLGPVTIGGMVQGGIGQTSGTIYAGNDLGAVTIGGSLEGGAGDASGSVGVTLTDTYSFSAKIGAVKIGAGLAGGDLKGGSGNFSGSIAAQSSIAGVTVKGSVMGGSGDTSGSIYASTGLVGFVMVGGGITGGDGASSGAVSAYTNLGNVTVQGSIVGGAGDSSGSIFASTGLVGSVTVGGGITGDAGFRTGVIWGNNGIGTVKIAGGLLGNDNEQTGMIISFGKIASITIGGSVVGTDYSYTGYVLGQQGIGKIVIGGNLQGGDNSNGDTYNTGSISAGGLGDQNIIGGAIGSIEVKGNIISGNKVNPDDDLQNSGAIRATGNIGALKVGQSIIGNPTMSVWITGLVNFGGSLQDNIAIGTVAVAGDVKYALILAGVLDAGSDGLYGGAAFARINSIVVNGNWEGSSIAAGADPGSNGYGVGDTLTDNVYDVPSGLSSKIAKIVIGGQIIPVAGQYGFVAQSFGSVSIGGVPQTIPPAGGTTFLTPDHSVVIHRI